MDWSSVLSNAFLASVLVATVPILFAALGGAFTQQAGILNIGLEGMILVGAFFAVAAGAATQSATLAVLAAVLSSTLLALLYAFASLNLRADNIIVGIGINLLGVGITIFLLSEWYNSQGSFQPDRFPALWRLEWGALREIPLLGALEGQTVLFFLAVAAVAASHLLLYRTRLGIHIRAVGESPQAAESSGISVYRVRMVAILLSGLFCGLAGAQLAMATIQMFVRDMSAGRGFIALAAATFGNATPVGSAVASLIFGVADAASTALQIASSIPPQFVLMVPYLVTLLALVVTRQRALATRKRRQAQGGVQPV